MAMSGIAVHQSVVDVFNKVKQEHMHKYFFSKISDNKKEIIIDEASEKHDTSTAEEDKHYFCEMKAKLTEAEPRYIVYDFGFTSKSGRKINKLAFAFWCSDNAPTKKKMLYASSKDDVKKSFDGVSHEFQFNDKDDLNYDKLREEVERKA